MQGLVYSEELTAMVRAEARAESARKVLSPNGKDYYYAQHIITTMQVFINPEVAMLPRHSGLMAEDGCYGGKKEGGGVEHVKCGGVKKNGQMDEQNTPMDPNYHVLEITPEMDKSWEQNVLASLKKE